MAITICYKTSVHIFHFTVAKQTSTKYYNIHPRFAIMQNYRLRVVEIKNWNVLNILTKANSKLLLNQFLTVLELLSLEACFNRLSFCVMLRQKIEFRMQTIHKLNSTMPILFKHGYVNSARKQINKVKIRNNVRSLVKVCYGLDTLHNCLICSKIYL